MKYTLKTRLPKGSMKSQKGFTLIELMIVVAIIGILAAIAIPQYTDYMNKSKAASAMSSLAAQKQQVALNNQFGKTGADLCLYDDGGAIGGCTDATGVLAASNDNVDVTLTPTFGAEGVTWACAVEVGGTATTVGLDCEP